MRFSRCDVCKKELEEMVMLNANVYYNKQSSYFNKDLCIPCFEKLKEALDRRSEQ